MNHCRDCTHFRSAPYEAKQAGCYFPANMSQKQSARYLDEQQQPGDHRKINLRGDCPDFEARRVELPWYRRLLSRRALSLGA
ncbi:MAG: hypothetical protein WD226_02295 [Planctomycetota bacterium]